MGFRVSSLPWRPRSLRATLLLAVVLPLGLAAVAGTFLTLRTVEEQAVRRMQDEVELVGRAIQLPLSRSLELGREGAVTTTLESAFRIGRVYGASVYDAEGTLLSSVGVGREDEEARIGELARGADDLGAYSRVGGEEVYSYFAPLTGSGGRSLGLLQITRERSDIDAHVAELRSRALLLLGAALLAIVALVLVGHHGSVGRYLDRLLASMARVESGSREHRAAQAGPREIARLASGLNAMLDSIARAEAEVRERGEEKLRLEAELKETEKLAAVGRLSAGVAHELGSPLAVIDGRAQQLLRRADLNADAGAELEELRDEVGRMAQIVRQLLEFGKGKGAAPRRVPAAQLARSALRVVAGEAAGHDVGLDFDEVSGDGKLQADPARVESALVNLLRNAIQAAPGGTVRLRCRCREGRIVFEVLDDGPGLSPEVRSRLFEPFFTTKPTGQGTGLGLAVVRGVAEEHGGEVVAENRPDGGARFELRLPRAAAEREERRPPAPAR